MQMSSPPPAKKKTLEGSQAVSPVSLSLQVEFLGHSHCCPILWIPHDNKVEKAGGWVVGALGGLLFAVLLTAHGSSVFLPRSPQHGRINAENEPSPRHGAHGAWPTGNQLPAYLSICPSPLPSVCTRFLSFLHSLSVSHISGSQLRGRAHSGLQLLSLSVRCLVGIASG